MKKFAKTMGLTYRGCLEQPLLIIAMLIALSIMSIMQLDKISFDASADSLMSRGDPELAFYNETFETFGQRAFLILTYTPNEGEVISAEHIKVLKELTSEIVAVPAVESVQSLLDAPLLRSPPIPITELAKGYKTIGSADVDFVLAKRELTESPLFKDLLISADGKTTAIRIDLVPDTEMARLKEALAAPGLDEDQAGELNKALRAQNAIAKAEQQDAIDSVRAIRNKYSDNALMYLGGVPMVASDMVQMVREDMTKFALVILGLLIVTLYGFFRRLRWVLFPLGTSALAILFMLGILGALNQPITAVSANFIALITIVTISFTIHLITRYRELYDEYKDDAAQCALAFETMRSKLAPCLYTALTTIVAFGSLLTADIVPVVDFGWIMCVGIVVSLFVTYSFFASVLVLLPKNELAQASKNSPWLTRWFAKISTESSGTVITAGVLVFVLAVLGVTQITLGNRLVEYFRGDTEIRQGLNFIDQQLGGTLPLEVVVQFPPYVPEEQIEGDDFDDFGSGEPDVFPERYWFTPEKVAVIDRIQGHLEDHPAFGKSVSLANLERLGRTFNGGQPLSYLELTAILDQVPETARTGFVFPYADPESGQMRISVRLHETGPVFDLNELIDGIENFATQEVGLDGENIRVTGVAVMFNGMLEQLIDSQMSTLAFVIIATFLMFALLLRSWYLAFVGLIPNLLAAAIILAFMGYAGIPLDLMTITIASIVIGIGVDDAIHYLHRYQDERALGQGSREAVASTHASIGSALYFTSLTVVIGFSVLLFSRFIPTVYFGALAALAMVLALTANLTLLPSILVRTDRKKHPKELLT